MSDIREEILSLVRWTVPTGWRQLTEGQKEYALRLLADGFDGARLQTACFLRWCGLTVRRRDRHGDWLLRDKGSGKLVALSAADIAVCVGRFDWLCRGDRYDTRLAHCWAGRLSPVNLLLRGVAFGDYLKMEIAYQGYMQSRDDTPLAHLCQLLYHRKGGARPAAWKPENHEALNCLLWYAYIKRAFACEWPHLFRRADVGGDGLPDMKSITDTQLRALTGGDITKLEAVKRADTWDALAELDAKAEEGERLRERERKLKGKE